MNEVAAASRPVRAKRRWWRMVVGYKGTKRGEVSVMRVVQYYDDSKERRGVVLTSVDCWERSLADLPIPYVV